MFRSGALSSIKVFSQKRALSGSVALNNGKEITLNAPYRILNLKNVKKSSKKKKKHIVLKREADDIEAVWLENLTGDSLKLFRKTSFGSYRRVNLQCLFEKLLELYPLTFRNACSVVKTSGNENAAPVKQRTESVSHEPKGPLPRLSDGVKSPACLSEFIIKHIMEFPLLRSEKENSLSKFGEMEVEEYGEVDAIMFPSVTAILNETMSYAARLRLKMWKDRKIAELGVEGFNKYQEDLLNEGSKLHATLKTYLQVRDKSLVSIDPEIQGCWKSLEKFLPEITDVKLVEESIHHPILMYKGIVDCVAAYRGTPCVIEWKKSGKAKPNISSTFDAPIQLCAYLGALPWHKNINVENGLVVVAYTNGNPAKVFELSRETCQLYWIEWLRRVQSFWLKKSSPVQEQTEL